MKYLPLLLLTGCGLSADLMIGAKVRDGGFHGPNPTATFRVRKAMPVGWCEYEHISHLTAGPPFGQSHEEDSLDQIGCGVTFGR